MTVLVVRVNEANIPTTGHVVRVSFHNQRPGTGVRALVLDGSAGGDDPWMSSAYVMLSRPPSPPPVPFPPPRVEGLETRITAGPAENSISPLGTIFRFQFEPTPSCLECGLPQGTVVHVRVEGARQVLEATDGVEGLHKARVVELRAHALGLAQARRAVGPHDLPVGG